MGSEGGRVVSHHLDMKFVFIQDVTPGHRHGQLLLNLLKPFQGLLYLHQ